MRVFSRISRLQTVRALLSAPHLPDALGTEDGPVHVGLSRRPQRHFDYEAICSPGRWDSESRNGESRIRANESPRYSPTALTAEIAASSALAGIN